MKEKGDRFIFGKEKEKQEKGTDLFGSPENWVTYFCTIYRGGGAAPTAQSCKLSLIIQDYHLFFAS
jgi:hypothetical protein